MLYYRIHAKIVRSLLGNTEPKAVFNPIVTGIFFSGRNDHIIVFDSSNLLTPSTEKGSAST